MPLLDHFHPPLQLRYPWDSFHSGWATRLADALNEEWLPADFLAAEHTHFPDSYEVRISHVAAGLTPVGVIELVSAANKDRAEERRAFATKCASYLHQGVSLVLIDIVTSRRANLHNEILRLMEAADESLLPAENFLYAVSYRPVMREGRAEIDIWHQNCVLGQCLPTLPLRLTGDLFVPVDFESTYQETCRKRRLA